VAARLSEVQKLNKALALESKIDFQRVEKERAGLIEVLVRKLDPAAVERLIAASLNYRAGRIGFGAYNRELQALVKSHGIAWSNYPSFERYIQYVLVAEDIDKFRLFDEIDTLKKEAVAAAVKTPVEKALMDLAEDVRLAHRLIRQEFGPAEWRLYAEHRRTAPALNDRVKAVLGADAPAAPDGRGDGPLRAFLHRGRASQRFPDGEPQGARGAHERENRDAGGGRFPHERTRTPVGQGRFFRS
jgi:hypothetical protein